MPAGELVWYQQHIRDYWDLDHPLERIIADRFVRGYVRSSRTELKRRVYPTNWTILRDLASSVLPAATIWEPAIRIATNSSSEFAQIRVSNFKVPVDPVRFAIALPSNQTYLRELLHSAITELRGGDFLEHLLEELGLVHA